MDIPTTLNDIRGQWAATGDANNSRACCEESSSSSRYFTRKSLTPEKVAACLAKHSEKIRERSTSCFPSCAGAFFPPQNAHVAVLACAPIPCVSLVHDFRVPG